jgi:C-terminal processing protease CtpA/Prc
MKRVIVLFMFLFLAAYSYAQSGLNKKYSAQQLKQDLDFLKQQLFDAHANPFTELSKAQYEKLFDSISAAIPDSADITTFYRIIKPAFANLSDEHSAISIDTNQLNNAYKNSPVFLPFTLSRRGNDFMVDNILSPNSGLVKGDKIIQINNIPIARLVQHCSMYTTGFPGQRINNALQQFGYLYGLSATISADHYKIKSGSRREVDVPGIDIKTWQNFINARSDNSKPYIQRITYTRFNDAGYINSCTFMTHGDKDFKVLQNEVDSIFRLIKADQPKALFIDVSKNSGGNSSVGDIIISDIYSKPYSTYQCNWRRSDEYLSLTRAWGRIDSNYFKAPVGSVIHFDSGQSYPPQDNPNRFNGKVYIIVGDGTFSSAMMFATVIKDNHIAEIIGQTPQNGHPDHFGELYNSQLPNTKLKYRFGVKEWIRPAGKQSDNYLRPDVIVDTDKYANAGELLKAISK